MKILSSIFFVIILFGCKDTKNQIVNKPTESNSQINNELHSVEDIKLEIYDFNGFKKYLNQKDDKVYIVNFWATWCAPCVKELPYFQEIHDEYKNKNVEVILVSLDFPDKLDSNLIPFIKKNSIQPKVILLDAPNENEWIPKIDESWSGAIPATIIYNKNKRSFYEQSFTREELINELEKFI